MKKNLVIIDADYVEDFLSDLKPEDNLLSVKRKFLGSFEECWIVFEGKMRGNWMESRDDDSWMEDYGYDPDEEDINEIVEKYIKKIKPMDLEDYTSELTSDQYNYLKDLFYEGKIQLNGERVARYKVK